MVESGTGSRDAPAETDLPAKAGGTAAEISTRLRQGILNGSYGFGERLPAERELAIHFGASRSTVREALRRLEETDLVRRRIGSGTFVNYRPQASDGNIVEDTSPLELIEARFVIEPQMTRLAVANATARDLERIAEALERLELAGSDQEAFSEADEQFHLMLAESTRNPLIVWIYRQINDVRCHAQWDAMKVKILSPERIGEYNRHHRRLFEALRSRDVEAAVAAMRDHMDQAHHDLLGARPL